VVEARRSKEGLLRVRTRRGGWASTHSKLGQELLTRTEVSGAFPWPWKRFHGLGSGPWGLRFADGHLPCSPHEIESGQRPDRRRRRRPRRRATTSR
jgi:hypothetical protein